MDRNYDNNENWRENRRREREQRLISRRDDTYFEAQDFSNDEMNRSNEANKYSDYNNRANDANRYNYSYNNERSNYEKPKKKRGIFKKLVAGVLCLLLGFGGGFAGASLYTNVNQSQQNVVGSTISINANDEMGIVEAVAKKALPSVVGITTTGKVNTFFGQREVKGVGSGVIINSNGYILTNSHVVSDGNTSKIQVLLDKDKTVDAKLLWNDAYMDLAVIKVEETGLPAADLGDSEKINIGEQAIAIGNPLGLEFNRSVTAGYVSGVDRTIETQDGKVITGLIQTDAAINNGNSGGPLLNKKGEVIGINTIKIGGTATEGLGFAIPINTAKEIVDAIISRGDKAPISLGIRVVDYQYFKARMGIEDNIEEGAMILEVVENSLAESAGLTRGDIILEIDGEKIKNSSQIRTVLFKHKEGDVIKIKFNQNNVTKTIDLKLKY